MADKGVKVKRAILWVLFLLGGVILSPVALIVGCFTDINAACNDASGIQEKKDE